MKVKSISGQVFMKGGHLFEALLEVEEGGRRLVKAVQLDSEIENTVEIPADEVELFALKGSAEILISSENSAGRGTKV